MGHCSTQQCPYYKKHTFPALHFPEYSDLSQSQDRYRNFPSSTLQHSLLQPTPDVSLRYGIVCIVYSTKRQSLCASH